MARFQINSQLPIDQLLLDSTPKPDGSQRRITLQLPGWAGHKPPDIRAGVGSYARVVSVAHNAAAKLSTFVVEALPNEAGVVYVYDGNAPGTEDAILRLAVGKVTNHAGMTHDLVADLLGRSEDPRKLWVYQRILAARNNAIPADRKDWDKLMADQPLKQITDPAHPNQWNCGAALNQFGFSNFGGDHYRGAMTPYYKPFAMPAPVNGKPVAARMADIRFDEDKLRKGLARIRELLAQKVAVTVFVVHHDGFHAAGGVIQASGKTHYLTIVGCDAKPDQFLTTDPWPGGSKLLYTSGILGDVETTFMGRLQVFEKGGLAVGSPVNNHGSAHDYLLLTGPT